MRLGYVVTAGEGEGNALLSELIETLPAPLRVAGAIQKNTETSDCTPCNMDLHVLPEGPALRISQSLGAGASGCRLNSPALEEAVGLVTASLESEPDLVVINKFGKVEASGQGFRQVLEACAIADIPVLTAVHPKNLDAFLAFSGGLAQALSPRSAELRTWVQNQITSSEQVSES